MQSVFFVLFSLLPARMFLHEPEPEPESSFGELGEYCGEVGLYAGDVGE